MITWSPAKLKLTLGIGTLAVAAFLSEVSQKSIPAWIAVGVSLVPLVLLLFADPDDLPIWVARPMQVVGSLWYLALSSVLMALFLLRHDRKPGWPIVFAGVLVGGVPCVIVLSRTVRYWLGERPEDRINSEPDVDLAMLQERPLATIDVSQPMVYGPSRGQTLLILLISLVFVGCGVLMVHDGKTGGWFGLAFFAVCALVALVQLVMDSAHLRLSAEGIGIRSLWRTHRYRWSDISWFYPGHLGPNKAVVFDFSPSYQPGRKGRAAAKALTGAEGALPDTYGFASEELADLLNQWKMAVQEAAGRS